MERTDVVIVGAGPNGLALASHLRRRNVEHVVFGDPMTTWRDHMPKGMCLKSEPYGSDIAAPSRGYQVKDYCARSGDEYVDRAWPLPRETFVAYGEWYARTLVPYVRRTQVTEIAARESGFSVLTETGHELRARRVVVATGLMPFSHVPALLGRLPSDLVTHSTAHADLGAFSGRRVAVVGSGQSGLETAALLYEAGAQVEVIGRDRELEWNPEPVDRAKPFAFARWPMTPMCEGWNCWRFVHLPDAFRRLPRHVRADKAFRTFGPAGAWWLKDRVVGKFPVHLGSRIIEAVPSGSTLRVVVDGTRRRESNYDHVIACTGFRVDVRKLDFLSAATRAALAVYAGAPVLSGSFESSVPGLFFTGSMAAASFGPNMRFLSGSHFSARRLSKSLAGKRRDEIVADDDDVAVDLTRTTVAV